MKKTYILCLHGWGGSHESFLELRAALEDSSIEVLSPDLPGFGEEKDPKIPMTNDDYAQWVTQWIQNNAPWKDGDNWYLLGHSHGGRIAIKLVTGRLQAANYSLPSRLFLCASAGIHHPRHTKRIIGLILAKIGKTIFSLPLLRTFQPISKKLLYKLVRVHDYEKASEVMRKTLINVTKEDLRPLLPHISVPTDIFWGTEDTMTPYSDAKIMEAEIPNAHLHTFTGTRHRVHRDNAKEIAKVICV